MPVDEATRGALQSSVQVFTTGKGYTLLRVSNGKHTVEAFIAYDAIRALCTALHATSEKELFNLLSKGDFVGKHWTSSYDK